MSARKRKFSLFFSSLFLFCLYVPQSCAANDTISTTQTITDGETLISKGEVFELGFFSPANSTRRYVGIWYKKNPDQKVVWVANGGNPLLDSSGVLKVGEDGNIVLLDGRENIVWSTNVSFGSNSSLATLLDEGNLVLLRSPLEQSDYLWQSFDHPSDTLVQGMKLGVNTRTGEKYELTSWKAEDDPSPGNFVLGVGRLQLPQLLIWNRSVPYWRSGEWNGSQFIGIPDMQSSYVNGTQLSSTGGVFFSFAVFQNGDIYIRTLNSSGTLKELIWYEGGTGWKERGRGNWWPPKDQCDIYGMCGPFGICNMDNSPICSCLHGFEPKFIEEWDKGNWTGGCIRRTQLQCAKNTTNAGNEKEDGFFSFKGTKLPDNSSVQVYNAKQCQEACSRNCSCLAYAMVKGIGCLLWGGDLVDIRQFSVGGQELFLRLAHSELGRKKQLKPYAIVLIAGSVLLCIMACILCAFKVNKRVGMKKVSVQMSHSYNIMDGSRKSSPYELSKEHEMEGDRLELPSFNFGTVAVATWNFSNKLGEGGFGPVYKGKLPDGTEIAVKRLSSNSGQGAEEFKNELKLICKLQHRNLVRLLGFCIEREEKILLYEYMPNKSLDAFLFDPTKRVLLDWGKRLNIIDGIARGLLYLHRDSRLKVIHRDLKASNILLDEDMNPKISDFGMARIFGGKQTLANTNRVVGTYGYMSPEYAMEGTFSEKSDVFSFGVLLLEIVSSKRNSSLILLEQSPNLLGHVWRLWNEHKVLELMDPTLLSSYNPQEVMRCIHMALLCVQEHAVDRPSMSTIVSMLGSWATLPVPKQPAFTLARKYMVLEDPSQKQSSDATPVFASSITTVEAR